MRRLSLAAVTDGRRKYPVQLTREGRHPAGEGRHPAGEGRHPAGEGRHPAGEGRASPHPTDGRREDPRRALGRRGEDLALAHFQALGFTLLTRNHRTRHGEIDLIVFDGETLVFVEVKTRRARVGGGGPDGPLDGLRVRQRRRLRRLAAAWLCQSPPRATARELRFDAVGVLLDERDQPLRLDHLEGAL
jgi:putative endonuclease